MAIPVLGIHDTAGNQLQGLPVDLRSYCWWKEMPQLSRSVVGLREHPLEQGIVGCRHMLPCTADVGCYALFLKKRSTSSFSGGFVSRLTTTKVTADTANMIATGIMPKTR